MDQLVRFEPGIEPLGTPEQHDGAEGRRVDGRAIADHPADASSGIAPKHAASPARPSKAGRGEQQADRGGREHPDEAEGAEDGDHEAMVAGADAQKTNRRPRGWVAAFCEGFRVTG